MSDLLQIGSFHFLRPEWLLLLLPISCVVYIALRQVPAKPDWDNLIAAHLLTALTVGDDTRSRFNPFNMGVLILTLCVLLMAGPTWQRQITPFVQDNAVLVVALDLSKSMDQTDIQPSRLERAKQKVSDLLELRGGARTGLVVFSGSAHQVIPLSNDPEIIRQFLAAVNSNMMPKQGKFPEKAIPLVEQMLSDSAAPGTILVIGDGIGPQTLAEFGTYFAQAPYQLIVLGIGLLSVDDRVDDVGDSLFGGAHLPLQEKSLQSLASAGDGRYLSSTPDKSDVLKINRMIERHLARVDDSARPWLDAGYYLLYPITLLFLLWFRRGWTLNGCFALLFVQTVFDPAPVYAEQSTPAIVIEQAQVAVIQDSSPSLLSHMQQAFMDLWLSRDQQGRYYFERGDYARAAQRFEHPQWQAVAFYYAENFDAAAQLFYQIDDTAGRFNLANALAQGQNYVQAVAIYSLILTEQPDHSGARKNKALVEQIIEDINRMSASQQAEAGKKSRQLGDKPQRADGAMQQDIGYDEVEQLTAQQILLDEQVREMWMRQVQADPARFLSAKFNLQYQRQRDQENAASEQAREQPESD